MKGWAGLELLLVIYTQARDCSTVLLVILLLTLPCAAPAAANSEGGAHSSIESRGAGRCPGRGCLVGLLGAVIVLSPAKSHVYHQYQGGTCE
jgi:hypothetical protein